MKKQLEILNEIVEDFKLDKRITAILLTGSVAYGAATEDSDLDIIVICDRNQFVSKYVNGILLEIHYQKYETMSQKLSENPMEIYKYLYSKVIYDNGQAAQLLAESKERYDNYRTPEKEKESIRYWLSATKSKLLSAIKENDDIKVSYLVSTNTWKVLEGVWAINNKPMPPSSLAFHKHDTVNIPLDNWFKGLFVGDVFSRANMMINIIDIICAQ